MTLHERPRSEALSAASPSLPRRGRWSWRRAIQGGWIMLALVLLVNFVFNIPAYYQAARIGCTSPNSEVCPTGLLTPGNFQYLAHLHLSVTAVAGFFATLTLAVSVLYWGVGLLIFWRKSQEWTGLLFSLVCIMMGSIGIFGFVASAQTPQFVQFVTNTILSTMNIAGLVFFIIFPTGHFTPRWTWVACVFVLLNSLPFVPPGVSFLVYPVLVGVQVYRYVRVYDAVQRQQTKWFIFAIGISFSFLLIYFVLGAVVPSLNTPDSWYQLLGALPWFLIWVLLLLSLSFAILRYRLWDIDILINRTLVYGSLTALLVVLYVGLILVLQTLMRAVTGSLSQQPLVVVVSTLVIAALFQPLRHRLQQVIDRRFYRRKYDAVRVLTTFNKTLRTEIDVDILREQLVAVVEETMQPTHVFLWVLKPGPKGTFSTHTDKSSPEEARVHEDITRL